MKRNALYTSFLCILVLTVSSCADSVYGRKYHSGYPGQYKVGKPYQIQGQWYTPKEEPSYDETGIASWYGSEFHGKKTANGDEFDRNAITAAHRTLPLPSVVRVTNLANGRTLAVMVNDRGPFSKGRIVDVSRHAAELLGFKEKGTTKVRVQYLPQESNQLLSKLDLRRPNGSKNSIQLATIEPDSLQLRPEIIPDPIPDLKTGKSANSENIALGSSPSTTVVTPLTEDLPPLQPSAPIVPTPISFSTPTNSAFSNASYTTTSSSPFTQPTTYTTTVGAGDIYVQLGAYSQNENAEKVRGKFQNKPVQIETGLTNAGQPLYIVRIGPLSTREQALSVLHEVMQAGFQDALIVH